MAVYQDTYLELSENIVAPTEDQLKNETLAVLEPIEAINEKKLLKINRPFFFAFVMKTHIVAIGRIKDPLWCKHCKRYYIKKWRALLSKRKNFKCNIISPL